ncbi:hypothetical protein ATE84_2847 [Aquimarina sp. MAR_2010_214]|uniref:fibronectin type III domain-containing protein n=1 Tax=Aquimarina sp. MAR_2010_214 TaxID=1250026 RepID=UPI000C704BF6|nr:hypothetical protein [Aquimarina sp. MAR_2010_214]PKV50780.1 hypothetical protein ATE84_2847 [Aquimarina sp. MAR_2010_214]
MKRFLYIVLLLGITVFGYGQAGENTSANEVQIIARYQKGKVLLRWAPITSSIWLKGNTYGYLLERFTIKKQGKLLTPPYERVILQDSIRPKPIEEWEDIVQKNDYAAIIAQGLYGESFQVEEIQDGIAQIINKSAEIEQRYSFSLYAADMNFEGAQMGALGYVDETTTPGEEYLYRIKSRVPQTKNIKEISSSVIVSTVHSEPLPSPIDLIAVPDDKSILLTWEYEMFKRVFTSYFVERSENGSDFKRLGDTPLVNLNDKPEHPAKRMYYVDTISQNNKTYHYRVIGVSPFGEESPASEVASAQGVKKLVEVPHISRHEFDSFGNVVIKWDFLKEAEQEITSFELNWAAQEAGPYKTVESNINPDTRKTVYKNPEPSNYFRIIAHGKNNQKTTSLSAFVQTIDSIPPSAPVGLVGVVDSLGVVQLKWQANIEKDMLGYRIFRGNLKNEEVTQLTISPIESTSFQDTVQVKSLNKKVYYQVVAVDQRFNMSEYSEKLALKKPDVIPPSSPIFSEYKVADRGVFLKWINSSSEDVIQHQLYRQNTKEADKGWQLLFETDTIHSYIDKDLESNQKYRYAIFAKDDSGLLSEPSVPVTVSVQNVNLDKVIKGFSGTVDRVSKKINLSWRVTAKEVQEVLIYKSKENETPVLWKQIPSSKTSLVDTKVSPNNIYVYHIKPYLKIGGYANMETIKIKY